MTWPPGAAVVRNGTFIEPRTLEALFWRSRGLRPVPTAQRMGTTVKAVDKQIEKARERLGLDVLGLDYLLARGGEFTKSLDME